MTITVYALDTNCQACRLTKRHFERRGIAFREAIIDDHAREVAEISGFTAAPIVQVTNDRGVSAYWCGYRPDNIDKLAFA